LFDHLDFSQPHAAVFFCNLLHIGSQALFPFLKCGAILPHADKGSPWALFWRSGAWTPLNYFFCFRTHLALIGFFLIPFHCPLIVQLSFFLTVVELTVYPFWSEAAFPYYRARHCIGLFLLPKAPSASLQKSADVVDTVTIRRHRSASGTFDFVSFRSTFPLFF